MHKLVNNSNIVLGLILGSGIDLDENIITDKAIYSIDRGGIHIKIVYTCKINGKELLVFKGRKHFYEGFSRDEMLENIRIAKEHGVRNLLITNAAGGLNENFIDGDLMLITSHISFNNKLVYHKNSDPYSHELIEKFKRACMKSKVKLQEGLYGFYSGPTYETKAEIRMQKKIGLDAAGMSTIPEVYEAASLGMKVISVSVITNLLKENAILPASHEDVLFTAQKASASLNKAIENLISELN
jgi:purine-nucleoside phosphorylase